jgi:hypothetical protein
VARYHGILGLILWFPELKFVSQCKVVFQIFDPRIFGKHERSESTIYQRIIFDVSLYLDWVKNEKKLDPSFSFFFLKAV